MLPLCPATVECVNVGIHFEIGPYHSISGHYLGEHDQDDWTLHGMQRTGIPRMSCQK